jgi:RNA polymerase sigma factor (sigma-70 family)
LLRLPYQGANMQQAVTGEPKQNIINAVRDYSKRLSAFIRERVNTDEDAEDILQDVWYRFARMMNSEPIEQVSGWLYRVAKNRIIDKYRKDKFLSLEIDDSSDEDEFQFREFFIAVTGNPETENLKELFWETLNNALDELPEDQRNVFTWNELEEIPFHEIVANTGENINTLISRKRYAVLHLRKRLVHLYKEVIQP